MLHVLRPCGNTNIADLVQADPFDACVAEQACQQQKDHALSTAKDLIGDDWSDDKSGLRKTELAKSMEQAFSENQKKHL